MGELGVNYAAVRLEKRTPVGERSEVHGAEVSLLHLCILKYSMMQSGDGNVVTCCWTMETSETVHQKMNL